MDTWVVCVLSSSLAATVVVAMKELWLWRLNRKAKIEDDRTESNDKDEQLQTQLNAQKETINEVLVLLKELDKKIDNSNRGSKIILKDRIKYIALNHITKDSITYEERAAIHEMWNTYHNDLGGNGDLNDIMDLVDKLPITVTHH